MRASWEKITHANRRVRLRPVSGGKRLASLVKSGYSICHMSRDYWEQRYQTKDMPWEKGAASPGLVDFLVAHPDLKKGSVCVPGCGTGHDAREFAQHGFEVSGFDLAPSAITLASGAPVADPARPVGVQASACAGDTLKRELQRAGSETGAPRFFLADFLRDEPPQKFDWLFEHTLFCAIQPSERDEYVRAALRWLKPGGNYLAVNYFIPDTDGPPFGVTREEIWERFSPHFELLAEWTPRSYPNRTNLERMFWWSLRTA